MLLYLFAALDSAETLAQGHDTMLPRQVDQIPGEVDQTTGA